MLSVALKKNGEDKDNDENGDFLTPGKLVTSGIRQGHYSLFKNIIIMDSRYCR